MKLTTPFAAHVLMLELRKIFPTATLTRHQLTDPESPRERPCVHVETGIEGFESLLIHENVFYEVVKGSPVLTQALRQVTVIFD